MAWFGKPKRTAVEVSAYLALEVIPLRSFESDISYQKQAIEAGVDLDLFKFEMLAFQVFVFGQAINTERLHGRLTMDAAKSLSMEFIKSVSLRLETVKDAQSLPSNMAEYETSTLVELMVGRNASYIDLLVEEGSFDGVFKLFAEVCGLPESEVLRQIAQSILLIRGNIIGQALAKMNVVA